MNVPPTPGVAGPVLESAGDHPELDLGSQRLAIALAARQAVRNAAPDV